MDNNNSNVKNNKQTSNFSIPNSGMDEANKKAMKVLTTRGTGEFIKHVFTGDNGKQLTYAEMRAKYG